MESTATAIDLSPAAREEKSTVESQPLEPWGRLVSGEPGVSASRIAEALGVSPTLIKGLARPVGYMKMPHRYAFEVYAPALTVELAQHPRSRRPVRAGAVSRAPSRP